MQVRKLPEPEREKTEMNKGTSPCVHIGTEIVRVPTTSVEKSHNSWCVG